MVRTKKIIKIEKEGRNVFVPAKLGRTICSAYEDVRKVVGENEFSKTISKALHNIDEQMELDMENETKSDSQESNDHENAKDSDNEEGFENSNEMSLLLIGENLEIYWPLDLQYYPGTVHSVEDGKYKISYDDG